jgi:hypothetical protein
VAACVAFLGYYLAELPTYHRARLHVWALPLGVLGAAAGSARARRRRAPLPVMLLAWVLQDLVRRRLAAAIRQTSP